MLTTLEKPKLDDEGQEIEDEYETVTELVTLNSMTPPIWKKNRSEITDEELNEFYKNKFYDFQDPEASILINVEGGLITYTALIFIPKKSRRIIYTLKIMKKVCNYILKASLLWISVKN